MYVYKVMKQSYSNLSCYHDCLQILATDWKDYKGNMYHHYAQTRCLEPAASYTFRYLTVIKLTHRSSVPHTCTQNKLNKSPDTTFEMIL